MGPEVLNLEDSIPMVNGKKPNLTGMIRTVGSVPTNARYKYSSTITKNDKVKYLKIIEQEVLKINGLKIKTKRYSKRSIMFGRTVTIKVQNNFSSGGTKSAIISNANNIYFGFAKNVFYIAVPGVEKYLQWVSAGVNDITYNAYLIASDIIQEKIEKTALETIPNLKFSFDPHKDDYTRQVNKILFGSVNKSKPMTSGEKYYYNQSINRMNQKAQAYEEQKARGFGF